MLPRGPCQLEGRRESANRSPAPLACQACTGRPPPHPSLSLHQGALLPTCIYRRGRGLGRKGLPKAMQSGSQELGSRWDCNLSPLPPPLPSCPLSLPDTAGSHLSLYPVHLYKVAPGVRQICILFLGATL